MSIEQTLLTIAENGKRTNELLEALLSGGKPAKGKAAEKPAATPPTSTPPPAEPAKGKAAEKPAATPPTSTPPPAEPPKVEEPDPLDDTPAVVLNKDRIRGALVAYQTKNSKDAALALLGKHNAKSIGTLAEGTYPQIHAEIVADLGENAEALIQAAIAAAKK
jgi:hypothetical protein